MALNDWEVSYAGYTIGGDTDFALMEIRGLLDLPPLRAADHAQLRRDGEYPGDTFLGPKNIDILMDLTAKTESEFSILVTAIRDMTNPKREESPLVFKIPSAFGGAEVQFMARPRRRNINVDLSYLYRNTAVPISFKATYPYAVSTTLINTGLILTEEAGGRTYPRTYNLTYPTTSSGSSATITNAGNNDAEVVLTFTGPLTKPKATLTDTGEYLEFDLSLVAGQQLIVDTRSRTVLLEGTANRSGTITSGSTWWSLPPGTSSVAFTASLFETGTLSVGHRSTYS